MDTLGNPPRGQSPPRESSDPSRSLVLQYLCAVVTVALATWLRLLLDPLLGDQVPFPTFFLAILLTAWYGGMRPALLAVILAVVFLDYFLIPPRGSFGLQGVAEYVDLALFVAVGVGIATLGGVMQAKPRETIERLEQAQT